VRTLAILPVKSFGTAKQRLSGSLGAGARQALARAMFSDVLGSLQRVGGLDDVVVVTADRVAEAASAADGVRVLADTVQAGQSEAALIGVRHALAEGYERVLLVPGDTPLLEPGDLAGLLAVTHPVAIVPDRHGTGTNALVLSPPDAIEPSFGPDSLARHVKPGGSLVIDCYAKRWTHVIGWKYILRPITRRMDKPTLYGIVDRWVTRLLPLSTFLRRNFGAVGARILPILNYAHWGLPPELNKQWSTLDTFDHYSPWYDRPQTLKTVRGWYQKNGFRDIDVRYGANGIVASGRRPD